MLDNPDSYNRLLTQYRSEQGLNNERGGSDIQTSSYGNQLPDKSKTLGYLSRILKILTQDIEVLHTLKNDMNQYLDKVDKSRENIYQKHPHLRQYEQQYQEGTNRGRFLSSLIPQNILGIGVTTFGGSLIAKTTNSILAPGLKIAEKMWKKKIEVGSNLHLYEMHKKLNRHGPVEQMASNTIKGVRGEKAAEKTLQRFGYELKSCKLPGNTGFDHAGFKYDSNGVIKEIVLVESKFAQTGIGRLSSTGKGLQMGPKWIEKTLDEMGKSKDLNLRSTAKLIKDNWDKVKFKGNVLNSDGVNRWGQFTQKINELHK